MRISGKDKSEIYSKYVNLNEAGPVANMGRGAPGTTGTNINVGAEGPKIPRSPIAALKGEVPSTAGASPENNEEDVNENVSMAKSQLLSTADKAIELFDMIHNGGKGLEPWAFSKITLAADYIETIYDYMKYNEHAAPEGEATPEVETDVAAPETEELP